MSQTVITQAFEALKAQEAANHGVVTLDEFVFASVPNLNITDPISRTETLPPTAQIVHRQAVSKTGMVNSNAVVYSVVLGADVGDFEFNWVGLLNKASGAVAMIVHAPAQKKIKTASGQQGNVLTRSFLMEYNGASSQTNITTPADTWQIDFTARLGGVDERIRLENIDAYGTASFLSDGFLVTTTNGSYQVKKGVAYIAGLRAELLFDQTVTVSARPTKIWVDVCWRGTLTSVWATGTKLTVADTLVNYVSGDEHHFVFAIAEVLSDGSVNDLRQISPLAQLMGLTAKPDVIPFFNKKAKLDTSSISDFSRALLASTDAEKALDHLDLSSAGGAGGIGGIAPPITWKGFAGGADPTGSEDSTPAIIAAGNVLSAKGGGVLRWPAGDYKYTFSKPPYGVTWDMDGPNIKRENLGGAAGAIFQTAKFTYLPGPHVTTQLHAEHIRAISKGSGAIGAPYADYALGLTIEKENWSETNGIPGAGEINGMMIYSRNGCVTGDPVKTGGAAILADIGQTEGSGYTQLLEVVNSVFAKGTLALTRQTNLQLLGIDEKSGDSWGAIFNSKLGSQSGCIRIVGTDASPWNYILQSWKNSEHVFYLNDLGKHRWRVNGKSMSLEQDPATGAMVMRNEAGVAIEWTTPGGKASLCSVNVQTGTSYAINTSEITGDLMKMVVMANASPITVTLPSNAPSGFHCEVIQRDPGQVTFIAGAGATLQHVDGHVKTKGASAVVRLRVRGNGNGNSAIWVLDGDTA